MSKFSNCITVDMDRHRPVMPSRAHVTVMETDPVCQPATPTLQRLYELRGTFVVEFWSTPAARGDAAKRAYRTMLSGVHREELALLWELRQAVDDGSTDTAMRLLGLLEDSLMGKLD